MSTALESIQEKIKAELANQPNTVAPPSGRNISTRGKVFTLPDGTSSQGPLQAVILDHRNFNRYYTKPYDPQNPAPPDCFAISKELTTMAPHEDAAEKQAKSCAECPMNQFGSAANGKGKACRNTVRLAVAAADATANSEPMILTVSPTGLKSWHSMVNTLGATGLLPIQVVTEIAFDANAPYPTLTFTAGQAHEDLETFWQLRDKAQALLDQPPA